MRNPFTLQGMNVLITGASSGIGKQCAISCSQMDANVILIARNLERLKLVMNELGKGKHSYYVLDLLDFDKYPETINKIIKENGKISGFIHSAGIEATIPLNALKPHVYEEVYKTNAISCFELIRFLSKKKNIGNSASFIAIASIMGIVGQKGKLAYCSSKAALINGVKSLALELAQKQIRVNSISPAIVETEMVDSLFSTMSKENMNIIEQNHPLGFGKPEDVANACVYLLSNASRWVTGTNLVIDGGYSAK